LLGYAVSFIGSSQNQTESFSDTEAFLQQQNSKCLELNPWLKKIDTNKSPMIGVLTQTMGDERLKANPGYTSYIMSAYVKFIESSGGRVVPMIWNQTEAVTKEQMSKLDGVLFPGGGGDYNDLGKFVLKEAMELNDKGHFFPVWGTCLGFERLALFTADKPETVLEKYGSIHHSLPVKFTKKPYESKMFCEMGPEAYLFEKGNFTFNAHSFSIDPKTFETDSALSKFWDVTSTSYDKVNDREFVATMEAKNYPFMATQFHPEKTTEVWAPGYEINHSWESIRLNRHFIDQFVQMARVNPSSWEPYADAQNNTIAHSKLVTGTDYLGDIYVF